MKQVGDIFFCKNLIFENGKVDPVEHPVVVVGTDEDKLYCCQMTSQTKHVKDPGPYQKFNKYVKFVEVESDKDVLVYNKKDGLINTTKIHVLDGKNYVNELAVGRLTNASKLSEIKMKYVFQQEELMPENAHNNDEICKTCNININQIQAQPLYKWTQDYFNNNCSNIYDSIIRSYDQISAADQRGPIITTPYNTYPPQTKQFNESIEYLRNLRDTLKQAQEENEHEIGGPGRSV